jgi:IS5 family transposase
VAFRVSLADEARRRRGSLPGLRADERAIVEVDPIRETAAVTHPADSKLIHRGVEILGRLARRHGIALRQFHTRVSTHARREVARLIHPARHREAERKVGPMSTLLGWIVRDIARKIAGAAEAVRTVFGTPLERIARLQRRWR